MRDEIERVLSEKAEALRKYRDLEVTRCGSWLWVSGNTRDHKDSLKELGLRWAPKKQKWYFAGPPRRGGKKTMAGSHIREKYGEDVLQEAAVV